MRHTERLYDALLEDHLTSHRQMAFVSGARQVGKTTVCRRLSDVYLSWDDADHRRTLLRSTSDLAARLELDRLRERPRVLTLDEFHKNRRWKAFLKGFFDTHEAQVRILVTGSSRLDVARRGGDSLMGRYLPYRMHPFSVAEVISPNLPPLEDVLRAPAPIEESAWAALWDHGGFPEPFLKRDRRFTHRWRTLRREQLVREDLRDLTRIQELARLEVLVTVLQERSGQQLVYSNLASEVQVTVDTIRRWMDTLCGLHLGFRLRPWHRNVSRSLRKEPKWYLRDWSGVEDPGRRAETLVACHLLKAVEGWTDLGLGTFTLGYLRDKDKREVDFVVVRDGTPWILVETKHGNEDLAPALRHFQTQTRAPLALQVQVDAPYVDADVRSRPGEPLRVPARTFLSQLL